MVVDGGHPALLVLRVCIFVTPAPPTVTPEREDGRTFAKNRDLPTSLRNNPVPGGALGLQGTTVCVGSEQLGTEG